jgi:YHS domain-containing protein
MKKILLLAAIAVVGMACGNGHNGPGKGGDSTGHVMGDTVAKVAGVKVDPVCDMPRDHAWTDYAMNGSDTVWFCSETCKKAFEGNKKKYLGKLNKG